MGIRLLAGLKAYREEFIMKDFIGSSDIFALVESGSFVFETENGRYTVNANEGALFRKNVLYHREIISPVTMHLFRYLSDSPVFLCEHVTFCDTERIRSTLNLLDKLDKCVLKDDFAYRSSLFCDVCTQYALENGTPLVLRNETDAAIEKALTEINGSIHKSISLNDICKMTGLSYVQFIRRFKAVTGVTPTDYVSAKRMQKAKQLLSDSTLSVRQIAYACGFENEYYFSNFFKKHTSLSPTAFRRSTI